METQDLPTAEVSVRVVFGTGGGASVSTGLAVLDYLVGELARTAGMTLSLEVAPGTGDREAVAAGRALGEALAGPLRAEGAPGRGFAWLPADEALAGAVLEGKDPQNVLLAIFKGLGAALGEACRTSDRGRAR